ncbi:hypothetical protein Q7P36_010587 [Cladosporium allicinum]
MQFIAISAFALATVAAALPATANENSAVVVNEKYAGEVIRISLPTGCSEKDLFKCAFHLIGTTASCGAAIIEIGANPAADLACIGSAAGTAANFDECKNCIPQ